LNKTAITNAADILSNIAAKISHSIATSYPENAGVATTTSIASEAGKISGYLTFTNTTEQSAATFAKVFKSGCIECSTTMVSYD
jgi:fructoselysine-6-P-deglycase FrlB-like protein